MKKLRIKLQFFAEEGADTTAETTPAETESEQTVTTENVTSGKNEDAGEKTQVEKLFTQQDLDAMINKRMAREKGASSFLEKLATRQNMSVDDFMKSVETAISNQEIQNYSEEKGVSQDIAKEMFEMKQRLSDIEAEKNKLAKDKELQQEWKEFNDEFPDVKPEDIPKEVLDNASKGVKLVDAYSRYAYKQLKSTQEDVRKNAVKDYLAGKLKIEPVEGAGSSVVVAPPSAPKTFDEARKQSLEFLKNSKEFRV